MDFELVISGLCLVAMRSSEPRPENPTAVDILCPRAHCHRARLSYDFTQVEPAITPDLLIDQNGGRFASFPLDDISLEFTFAKSPHSKFVVQWGPDNPGTPPPENWMNWIPQVEELGFPMVGVSENGRPKGATARITLPYGELAARDVVRDQQTGGFALWEFPATVTAERQRPIEKSIANTVIYRAAGVGTLKVTDGRRRVLTAGSQARRTTFRMCISNDLAELPPDTPKETTELKHLKHFGELARGGEFKAPKLVGGQRTGGGPICDPVLSVYPKR